MIIFYFILNSCYFLFIIFIDSKDDPVFVQDISTIWRLILVEGISIAAFTENPNGGKPIIAGMNALGLDFRDHKDSISEYKVGFFILKFFEKYIFYCCNKCFYLFIRKLPYYLYYICHKCLYSR